MRFRFKYKHPMAVIALAGLGAVVQPGSARADATVSGWMCVDQYDQTPSVVHYSADGGMANNSDTTAYTFGCPLVRELSDLDSVIVYLNDRSPSDGFDCTASELGRWGAGNWSPTRSTPSGFLGQTSLTFFDNELASADSRSQYNVSCVVPAEDATNGRSTIRSIRWLES